VIFEGSSATIHGKIPIRRGISSSVLAEGVAEPSLFYGFAQLSPGWIENMEINKSGHNPALRMGFLGRTI